MAPRLVLAAALMTLLRAQQPGAAPQADPVEQQRGAVAAAESAHGAESLEVAAQLVKLGQLLAARSAYAEALPVHRRALAIREARLPADSTLTDVARVNVASALVALDDPAAAVPLLRQVADAGEARAPSRLTAGALTNLGVAECKLGDYAAADEHLVAAIAMFRAHFPDHPFTGIALQNLAQLRLNQGRVDEARQLLGEVVTSIERSDAGSARHAMALFGMGLALARAERTDEAVACLERSHAMLADRTATASQRRDVEFRLGWLRCRNGDLTTAVRHLEQAADATPSTTQLRVQVTLARTLLRLERPEAAAQHLAAAERIAATLAVPLVQCVDLGFARAELAAAQHDLPAAIVAWRALLRAIDSIDAETAQDARAALARALRDHGDHDAAIAELLVNLRSFDATSTRVLPAMFEAERLHYVARHRSDLDLLLDYLASEPSRLPAHAAYAAIVTWKGQVARGAQDGFARARRDPNAVARLRRLRELTSDEAQGKGDPASRNERERILTGLANDHPTTSATVGTAAVQTGLGRDEALLDYVTWQPPAGASQLLAFVVTADAVQAVPLGAADAVARIVEQHLLMTSRSVEPGAAVLARDVARRAHAAVFAPLTTALPHCTRLWICPDGVLATLPFETLPDERDDTYLLERFRIEYLQSPIQLLQGPAAALATRVVALGAIDYGDAVIAGATSPRGAHRQFAALPQTELELRDIERAAGAEACCIVRGASATEARLRELAPTATVLHLATHGFYGGEGPLAAGIALAGANRATAAAGADDGVLTATEAALLDLDACRLVVLSSCQSGLGKPFAGESVLGLRRGLLQAGARCTITSMWPVGDRSTAQLMADFYQRLLVVGESPGIALRQAQLQTLARARTEHGEGLPGLWGAFVCEGR